MADRNLLHIFVDRPAQPEPYTSPPRRIEGRAWQAPDNRRNHGELLGAQLQRAEELGLVQRAARLEGALDGLYVTFESFPDIELAIESLDVRQGRVHPELRALKVVMGPDGQPVEQATVFIPDGKLGHFIQRVQQYLESAETERPRNFNLIDRIQSIALSGIENIWTDRPEDLPEPGAVVWWEVWLRYRDGQEVTRLRSFAEGSDVIVDSRVLSFPERQVVLVRATAAQLAGALSVLDDLAELRAPRAFPQALALETAVDQREWVDQLASRTEAAESSAAAVCVLDTGVSREHPLLVQSLAASDCHTCDPAWNTNDHHGHGTAMAGIALYGDLGAAILSDTTIHLRHRLESVKLLPPLGENPPELYGALTATGASLVEDRSSHTSSPVLDGNYRDA